MPLYPIQMFLKSLEKVFPIVSVSATITRSRLPFTHQYVPLVLRQVFMCIKGKCTVTHWPWLCTRMKAQFLPAYLRDH